MKIHNAFASTILIALFTLNNVLAQAPSTPEEQAKAVELARLLENDPLGKGSKEARQWFRDWMKHSRVRFIPNCSGFFESQDKQKYSEELSLQFKMSTAAFIIEHPEQAQDPNARLLAGMTGMLKAYVKLLQKSPSSSSPFLDSVIALQNNNKMTDNVRELMARCSDVPLSDKNSRLPSGEIVYSPIEVERLPYVPRLRFPQYPPNARQNRTQGKVVLHVVFAPTGNIADIEVIDGLRDGLTESSISAARTVTIEPPLVGGKPVATMLKLEYRFIAE